MNFEKVRMKFSGISLCFVLSFLFTNAQINTDSVRNKLNTQKLTVTRRINSLNLLASHYNQDSTNQALLYANEAYLLALKENDKYLQGQSLLNLAEGYLYNDGYDQALQYAFSALDIFQRSGRDADLAECYRLLGWVFYDSENADFAMQYHRKAYKAYTKLNNRKGMGLSLNAIGLVYQLKDEHAAAKPYFERALTIARQINNRSAIAASLNNIGICENDLGNYRSAVALLNRSLLMFRSLGSELSEAETLNQLAFSQLKLKNYPESRKMLEQSRQLIKGASSNMKKEKLLDNLSISSKLNEHLGNYSEAFKDLQEYTIIRDQIISRTKSDAVAANKLKRETAENEMQIKSLLAERELRSFQRNALATGIVLLVIIGFLLYSRLRQRQKKENELYQIRQELIKQELDNAMLEKEALNNKLDYKNSELQNYALYISQRNELVRGFTDDLNSLKNEVQQDMTKFNQLVRKFQYDLEINKEAQDFNLNIEEMHKDFFYNLLQRYPELTQNERRLCAQIRLNLSIKDIASLNNISIKSAEMARYRLRKHFNLAHEDSLNEFLKGF